MDFKAILTALFTGLPLRNPSRSRKAWERISSWPSMSAQNHTERDYSIDAMNRTHRWLERCVRSKQRTDRPSGWCGRRFPPDLRKQSAEFIASQDLPGSAIGGLSVGESKTEEIHTMIEVVNQVLPADKPRYLMGGWVDRGTDDGIWRGVDILLAFCPPPRSPPCCLHSNRKNKPGKCGKCER